MWRARRWGVQFDVDDLSSFRGFVIEKPSQVHFLKKYNQSNAHRWHEGLPPAMVGLWGSLHYDS